MEKRDFISLADYSTEELKEIVDLAIAIKKDPLKYSKSLDGKILGMIFQKNSTRTRISFQSGIYQLGGTGFFFGASDLQLSRGETISDTAKVLSRYMDGIMIRTFDHRDVLELAKHADIPVINGLTDYNHPCQVMADILTIREKLGNDIAGKKFSYVGDGNNMTLSLIFMCAHFGLDISVICPEGYSLENTKDIVEQAQKINTKIKIEFTSDIEKGVKGSHVVYTDTWTSMGQESQRVQKLKDLDAYRVTDQVMSYAHADAIFMHCLPAHRGEEVDSSVIDGKQSVVFDEAENRMHVQKAIMYKLMK